MVLMCDTYATTRHMGVQVSADFRTTLSQRVCVGSMIRYTQLCREGKD